MPRARGWTDACEVSAASRNLEGIWPEAPSGPGRGQLLVGDRLRLRGVLVTQPEHAALVRRSARCLPNGELIQEVWGRWLSFDLVVQRARPSRQPRKLSGIPLHAGSKDDDNLRRVIGCSVIICTRPGSTTKPARTLETTAVGSPSATRWPCSGVASSGCRLMSMLDRHHERSGPDGRHRGPFLREWAGE